MYEHETVARRRYYERTIERINRTLDVSGDLCFVFVQHAFLPSIDFYNSIEKRIAAIILKGSSSAQNPSVVAKLKSKYGPRVLDNVGRSDLNNSHISLNILRQTTQGRPFVILEYGAYFAPVISYIHKDPLLASNLMGVVEGTTNGIEGSTDGKTTGYKAVARLAPCPIISKSRSKIKRIMDIEIGPAIIHSSDRIISKTLGRKLKHWRSTIGVVGLGSIGRGVLSSLKLQNHLPLVYDTDLAVMAEMAHLQNRIVGQRTILEQSDILYLCTGSCFLAENQDLLSVIKNNALLILCTSGDVEAGIPQLIEAGCLQLIQDQDYEDVAVYATRYGKYVRIMLGTDGIGQAPNMSSDDGSTSPANVMSDMEFYALGCYLGTKHRMVSGKIHQSPEFIQNLILQEWLTEFYPLSGDTFLQAVSTKTIDSRHKEAVDTY